MRITILSIVLILLSCQQICWAQERLAVLPLSGIGVDASTQETVHQLLVSEITQLKKYQIVPENDVLSAMGDRTCADAACAAEIGTMTGASKVVYGSLNRLGEKIIFQYHLIDVSSGETILSDDLTALQVEELDQVAKRVAASIVQQKPVEKTIEVGTVTEKESQESKERKANSSWGIGFGYLYPQDGYDNYDNKDRFFVWDFRSIFEMRHIAVDALLGIRKGIALNVGCLYLVSNKDFSPYVGAGVGFHAVSHETTYASPAAYDNREDKADDGFEILLKGGMLAFRTYDFRVVATVEYSMTFNDYDDRAIVLTIGVMRSGSRVFGIF
ncbi:MAG: hypothetical protein ABIK83_04680 [Candidatus Zixiibacteriota bacterium]